MRFTAPKGRLACKALVNKVLYPTTVALFLACFGVFSHASLYAASLSEANPFYSPGIADDIIRQTANHEQNLQIDFLATGIRLTPRIPTAPSWEWGMTLFGYGDRHILHPVPSPRVTTIKNRIEYVYPELTEWYVHDERGVEHGFTIPRPFHGHDSNEGVTLELAITGNLKPRMAEDGNTLEFVTPAGVVAIRYSDLFAYDATGKHLPARFGLLPAKRRIQILVDDADANYPITIDPLATSPNWHVEGNQENLRLGLSMDATGDINGDSFDDAIVGTPHYANGTGQIQIYYGSPAGLPNTPSLTLIGPEEKSFFGRAVSMAGDVNNDGFDDVIVGVPYYTNEIYEDGWYGVNEWYGIGKVYIYHGTAEGLSNTPAVIIEGEQLESAFGFAVSNAGDVNGDGFDDVVVGAPMYMISYEYVGKAYVYSGSPTGIQPSPAWAVDSSNLGSSNIHNGDRFGISVSTAGDVNGDGFDDIIIAGAFVPSTVTTGGLVFGYYGAATGLSVIPNWSAEGSNIGRTISNAGDINNDGFDDVIIGCDMCSNGENNEGVTVVYYGSATGLSGVANWTFESNQLQAYLGSFVSSAGDINNDGYSDIVISSPAYNFGGRVLVFLGSSSGLNALPYWTLDSGQSLPNNPRLGDQLSAGDVNGDGFSDIIVSTSKYDQGQPDEGVVLAYYSSIDYSVDKLIVTLNSGYTLSDFLPQYSNTIDEAIQLCNITQGNVSLKKDLGMCRTYSVHLPAPLTVKALENLCLQFLQDTAVEQCSYNSFIHSDYTPNDPYAYPYGPQWNLYRINADIAWDQLQGSESVVIAVIDDFIDTSHPDLQNKIVQGYDFTTSDEGGNTFNHGTHVAGIIGAESDNSIGIAGIAGACRIMPINIGSASYETIFKAIEYAVDQKYAIDLNGNLKYDAIVINMSLSTPITHLGAEPNQRARNLALFSKWIQYAFQSNVPIVTSVGNLNWDVPHVPAFYSETIAVGATDRDNNRWLVSDRLPGIIGSSYGPHLEIVAPGESILSTLPGGGYGIKSGTSMAAPQVAGILGLLLSHNSDYTIEELRSILSHNAVDAIGKTRYDLGEVRIYEDQSGQDQFYGVGQLSAVNVEPDYLTIELSSPDLGNVEIGESSTMQVLIRNSWKPKTKVIFDAIQLSSLNSEHYNANEFSLSEQCSNQPINAGGNCQLGLTFSPHSAGAKSVALTIVSSLLDEYSSLLKSMTINIPLNGTATENVTPTPTISCSESGQHLSITPMSYDFGEVTLGEERTTWINIDSVCNQSTWMDIALNSASPEFTIPEMVLCQGVPSCHIGVQFSPVSEGIKQAEMLITILPPSQYCCDGSGAGAELSLAVSLSGIAIAPTPEPTPESTSTPIFTSTPEPSPTPDVTPTSEPTSTPNVIPTPEPNPTPTFTPTPSTIFPDAQLPTPVPTAVPSATQTPVNIPTAAISPIAIETPVFTITPTPTATPTKTPTATSTEIPAPTSTSLPEPTPASDVTPSPTSTPTPTATPRTNYSSSSSDMISTETPEPEPAAPTNSAVIPTPASQLTDSPQATSLPTPLPTSTPFPVTAPPLSTPDGLFELSPFPASSSSSTVAEPARFTPRSGAISSEADSDHPTSFFWPEIASTTQNQEVETDETACQGGECTASGDALVEQGNYEDAIEAYRQAQIAYHESGDRANEGEILKKMGAAALQAGHYGDAIAYYSRALETLLTVDEHITRIYELIEAGDAYRANGLNGDALETYQNAVQMIHETGVLQDRLVYLEERIHSLNVSQKQPADSEPERPSSIDALLVERNTSFPSEEIVQFPLSDGQGGITSQQSASAAPLPNIERIDELLKQGKDREALILTNEALETAQNKNDLRTEAELLNRIGLAASRQGRLAEAQNVYRQAENIQKEIGDEAGRARTSSNLGTLYHQLGNHEKAEESFKRSLQIFQELQHGKEEAILHNNLALQYYQRGRQAAQHGQYDQAADLYNKAQAHLKHAEELIIHIDEPLMLGSILNSTGLVHMAQGDLQKTRQRDTAAANDYRKALQLFQKALKRLVENGHRAGEGATRHNIGELYARTGHLEQASSAFQKALTIEREIGNPIDEARTLSNIGYIHEIRKQLPAASGYYHQSLDIQERLRTSVGIEEFKIEIAEQGKDVYLRAIRVQLLLGRSQEAFHLSERSRSRTLLDLIGNHHFDFRNSANRELLEREQELRTHLFQLYKRLQEEFKIPPFPNDNSDTIAALQEQIAVKQAQYEELLIDLKASNPEYASLVDIQPLELQQIQELLDEQVTLISYLVDADRTTVFVISRQSLNVATIAIEERVLRRAVAASRLKTERPHEKVLQSLQMLHRELIKPVKKHIKTPIVGIIPHSSLHYLSFAALTDGSETSQTQTGQSIFSDRQYLSDRYLLFTLPSASVYAFIQEKRHSSKNDRLLAVAYKGFPPLEYAEQEVREIARYEKNARLLSGDDATTTTFKALAGDFGRIHISAHARLNNISPFFSGISLSDRMLEIHELYGLTFANTNLAILSACNTQLSEFLGDYRPGREIVALNRAFLYAGVPSVIASLWNVNDRSTYELMTAFHRFLKNGFGEAQALQYAQSETRQQYPHPRHWAAFSLTGYPGEFQEGAVRLPAQQNASTNRNDVGSVAETEPKHEKESPPSSESENTASRGRQAKPPEKRAQSHIGGRFPKRAVFVLLGVTICVLAGIALRKTFRRPR